MADKIMLSEFLDVGKVIKTKHYNSNNWVNNLVYSFNNDSIEIDIGLEKDYIENIIMIGDTMRCKYSTDAFEYTMTGWVSRIKLEHPQSITIKIHEIERFLNNRKSYRYDVYLCSIIKKNKDDKKGVFAIVVNLSNIGLAFVVNEDLEKQLSKKGTLEKGDMLFFELYITSRKKVCFEGVIKGQSPSEKGKKYGVEITHIDKEDRNALEGFINRLEKKDNEIYNRQDGFWSKHSKYNK
ncbi:PilZ domain-containing protein [Acetivibrio saccincola]|uniref:PilZ domain protein n=1 Tax=Acetivibrio saccincola TaxID=1677857 RepID=A0A2K9EBD0_9FIRM|nr:PilZ domain-containing protein [Acetivibrio saccincola]AUG57464.1 PilZ domain protein [Acetivibrio saccincola]NLW27801.1 PilZ domain-containing protein [Acetivibrio saccincola]PQQ67385.1 pilus assembly protein PilZ [Acetivibrio saccincola]HOA98169.1 PilZ domain-containing protein [Acetivibrio saccincola]